MNKLNELKEKKLDNKGFSLVELIIVIAIMAILIGVLAPQYMRYVERSREATDVDAIDSVVSAVATILADPMNKSDTATITPNTNGVVTAVLKAGDAASTDGDTALKEIIPQMPTLKSSAYKKDWEITFKSNGEVNVTPKELADALGYSSPSGS